MKKILCVSLLMMACAVQTVQAQDAKAKSILEAVSKKISSLKSIKANFAFHLNGSNGKVKETKKGSFSMKGQKYHVLIAGQEIICDNKTVWTYMKESNEVQISKYNPDEQSISPAKLLTNFYDKEYTYKYVGTRKVAGKTCDVIELVPTNKTKQLTKLELAVDKASSTIAGGNMWEKNGSSYQYEISNFTANPPLADNYFTFDAKAHPGVEVVDLR